MKTLSNAELQEAIALTSKMHRNSIDSAKTLLLSHLIDLMNEQYRRATYNHTLELEPMVATPDRYHLDGCHWSAPGRTDFDARVRAQDETWYGPGPDFDSGKVTAQDGPEWVEWGGGECPVHDGHDVEVKLRNRINIKDKEPHGWHWNHEYPTSNAHIIAYRDWTAWEQSK